MSTKNPLSKLIISECGKRGWKAPDLHRNANISRSAAYRIFDGAGSTSINNISKVLITLNLIGKDFQCNDDLIKENERLKKMIDHLLNEIDRLKKSK